MHQAVPVLPLQGAVHQTEKTLVSTSVDAFIVLASAIVFPTALFFRRQSQTLTLCHTLLFAIVLHMLFVLYVIVVRWPPNIFQRLEILPNTPSKSIRAVLLLNAPTSLKFLPSLVSLGPLDASFLLVRAWYVIRQVSLSRFAMQRVH